MAERLGSIDLGLVGLVLGSRISRGCHWNRTGGQVLLNWIHHRYKNAHPVRRKADVGAKWEVLVAGFK